MYSHKTKASGHSRATNFWQGNLAVSHGTSLSKLFATVLLLSSLMACSSSNPQLAEAQRSARSLPTAAEVDQYNALVKAADKIICRGERKLGNLRTVRVCRRSRDLSEPVRKPGSSIF